MLVGLGRSPVSVLSQKFVDEVFLVREAFRSPGRGEILKPRAEALGCTALTPVPSPARAGEGTGVRAVRLTHGLRRGLRYFARSAG